MSYIEKINWPFNYAWIGGVNNGTHWYWNQAGTEPNAEICYNGIIPAATATDNLLISKTYTSPASSNAAVVNIPSFVTLFGIWKCFRLPYILENHHSYTLSSVTGSGHVLYDHLPCFVTVNMP